MSLREELNMPQWVEDCVDFYLSTEKRGPTVGELLAWGEADASCRIERDHFENLPPCGLDQ